MSTGKGGYLTGAEFSDSIHLNICGEEQIIEAGDIFNLTHKNNIINLEKMNPILLIVAPEFPPS